MERHLAAFLARASRKSFALGSFDCGIWLADWCLEVRGVDPAQNMRGRYDTIEQAFALARRRSLPALVNKLFRDVGVRRALGPPDHGDAAVIQIGENDARGAIIIHKAIAGGAAIMTSYVVIAAGGGVSRVPANMVHRICAWSLQPVGRDA